MDEEVVRKPLVGGEKWSPMGRLRNGYLISTEFSSFRFDGFVPAEEIERGDICRIRYFLSHTLEMKLTDLERRTQ